MYKRWGISNTTVIVTSIIVLAAAGVIVSVIKLDVTGQSGSRLGNEFKYDIKELTRIDPALILYEESAVSIATGMESCNELVIDSMDRVLVAGDKVLKIFTKKGQLSMEIALEESPNCLTTEGMKIYIGFNDHIEVYDYLGGRMSTWESLGENAILTSLAVFKEHIFAADAGNKVVVHYDTKGEIINYIGKKDDVRNIPGFVIPSPNFDIAIGSDRLLWVVNPGMCRLEGYTFNGDLEYTWGRNSMGLEGFCGCCNPANFTIDAKGNFITCEKGLIRVKIYDPEGEFIGVVAGPEQLDKNGPWRICETPQMCQEGAFDVAVDKDGSVYILDTKQKIVRIFNRKK